MPDFPVNESETSDSATVPVGQNPLPAQGTLSIQRIPPSEDEIKKQLFLQQKKFQKAMEKHRREISADEKKVPVNEAPPPANGSCGSNLKRKSSSNDLGPLGEPPFVYLAGCHGYQPPLVNRQSNACPTDQKNTKFPDPALPRKPTDVKTP